MYIWWIFLLLAYKTVADQSGSELANNGGILRVEVSTKDIGRIKHRDGEVVIAQNQQKHTDFFFSPFPYLQPEETQCHQNVLNGRIELGLQVELYTPQLIQAVKEYLYKYQSSLCGNTTSTFVCDVYILPMNSIRLVQRGSRSNVTHHMYTLEESWHPTTLRLQSMEFVIYASNMTVCEQLREALTEKCRLSNFEVHYTLHGQQTVQRQLEVNMEHVTSTPIYNQIRAQFPSAETVVLTENNFKELVSESIDRVTMTLRTQEEFEHLQDSMSIDKLLKQQLSTQKVQLKMANDKLWENLYWTLELTRPDRLAKVLNSIIRKESGASERFVYDRQAAKDAMKDDFTQHDIHQTDMIRDDSSEMDQSLDDADRANLRQHDIDHFNSLKQYGDRAHLTHHDKQHLERFDKLFDSHGQFNSSSNAQNDNDETKGKFKVFGSFKFGGDVSDATQTRSESSDNQDDAGDKQQENISDVDILNEMHIDKPNLNVLGIGRNHLNRTWIDKEGSVSTQANSNNLNEMKTNTNNLNATKIDKNTDKQYTFSRNSVKKFLRELFNNVYLSGDIIKPRPINAFLVKIGKLSMNTKLFSNAVLVRMRPNVHALPLRCKPGDNGGKSKLWLTDRVDRIENVLLNLSNHAEITKLHGEIRNVHDKISVVENKTKETVTNCKQEMETTINKINLQTDDLYTNLTEMVKEGINATSSKINIQTDDLYTNLTDMVKREINATYNKINAHTDDLYTNLTNMMKHEINPTSNKINVQTDDLYKNLTCMMKHEINAISKKINVQTDDLYKNLTRMMKQEIDAASNNINIRINNLDTTLSDRMNQATLSKVSPSYSSSLTSSSSKYQRPNKTGECFYYETIRVQVLLNGAYDIACNSSIDTYGYIYKNSFYATSPYLNLITSDDDGNGSSQFKLNVYLQTGTEYILVVTTYSAQVTGAFTIYTTPGLSFS